MAVSAAIGLLAPAGASAASISAPNNPPYETDTLTGNDEASGLSPSREWLRCDSQGNGCGVVASGQTYTLVQDDVGSTIRYRFDCLLCSPMTSSPTGVVREASPAITSQTITRTGSQQRTLNAPPVTGRPQSLNVTRQWLRCDDATEASCSAIPGANGATFTLGTADIGKRLRVETTASNPQGSANDTSDPTTVIAAAPPSVISAPRVLGTPQQGLTLGSASGTYGGQAPISVVSRAWARCTGTTAASCSFIPGATGATYTPGSADVGRRLRIAVTAEGLGKTSSLSGASAVVAPPTPVFVDVPPITPTPASPAVLSPFPRIGIAGRARRASTRLTKFVVRAPRGSRITVRCRGRGCPFRRSSARAGRRAVRFRRLQRSFRRGTVIEVFITGRGKVGKYARFRFRSRKAPSRVDACVKPGARRPSPCP